MRQFGDRRRSGFAVVASSDRFRVSLQPASVRSCRHAVGVPRRRLTANVVSTDRELGTAGRVLGRPVAGHHGLRQRNDAVRIARTDRGGRGRNRNRLLHVHQRARAALLHVQQVGFEAPVTLPVTYGKLR